MTEKEAETLRHLAAISKPAQISNSSREDIDTLNLLISRGFVEKLTYVNKENILIRTYAFQITPAGRIALAEHQQKLHDLLEQETREDARDHRRRLDEWLRFFIGLVVGWLLGACSPVNLFDLIAKTLKLR